MTWTLDSTPSQAGRTFVVTGANSGLGLETARELARLGGRVVMACRTPSKAEAAADDIRSEVPDAELEIRRLDLGDLESVREFGEAMRDDIELVDALINNAGVMIPPYGKTKDGFETQFGTNHLGHFALTAELLPLLEARPGARIVNLSSMMHWPGRIHWDDLQWERRYFAWPAYCQSKLANLLFSFELDRRLRDAGKDIAVLSAHPGYAATNLQPTDALNQLGNAILAQSAEAGALPTLRATLDPNARSGEYYGPRFGARGAPVRAKRHPRARDAASARRLWEVSKELTGAPYSEL